MGGRSKFTEQQKLAAVYRSYGADALQEHSTNKHYPVSLKIKVVHEYLSGAGSRSYLCSAAGVSRSGWYKWNSCEMTDAELEHGEHIGMKRAYRLARIAGLISVIRRKRPDYVRSRPEITAENVMARNFCADDVDQKLLTDVTEFRMAERGNEMS